MKDEKIQTFCEGRDQKVWKRVRDGADGWG